MLGVVLPVFYTFVAFLIYSLGNFKLSNLRSDGAGSIGYAKRTCRFIRRLFHIPFISNCKCLVTAYFGIVSKSYEQV